MADNFRSMLPHSMQESRTIQVIRNPKDTCVSYYHHMVDIKEYEYEGLFDGFFELYMHGPSKNGTCEECGSKRHAEPIVRTPDGQLWRNTLATIQLC